jgi:hypothetical protein
MHETSYQNNIYPLQNELLALVQGASVDFYLTGGTALSRFYLNHRYSDDLDFFVNQNSEFKAQCTKIVDVLKKTQFSCDIGTNSESFLRIFVTKNNVQTKVDFVNDVPFHYGGFETFDEFHRVDNWRNMLSNKICALSRLEPKDIIDVLFIAKSYPFRWEDIINEAKEKDLWVEPISISKIIKEINPDFLKNIKWIVKPAFNKIPGWIETLHNDIFYGNMNSLASK